MLFHTWTFLIFFVVAWCGYLLLRKTSLATGWLLAASYFFYGCWSPLFLLLVVYSTAVDYTAVWLMARTRVRTFWLVLSLVNNLGLLSLFKYADFAVENLNLLLRGIGLESSFELPGILLPVGISFYTFQSMSYTIDFYRGRIPLEPNLVRFAAYVALFPQLVAGPIERADSLLPQLKQKTQPRWADFAEGLSLFEIGLFKKLALANYLAMYVDPIYADPERASGLALIVGTVAFSWQIYFDFSGYTDMARGVARFFGFRLIVNFRHPYLAQGLSDFWSRWHISLSQWFRDYVYIPLGGNRVGPNRLAFNLLITFVLSGIWHGAAWTFVVWGLWHGLGMVGSRRLEESKVWKHVPAVVKRLCVYIFVCVGWIFFRAESMDDVFIIFSRMLSFAGEIQLPPIWMVALLTAVWAYQFLIESRWMRFITQPVFTIPMAVVMVLYLCLLGGDEAQPFIYFQF
ncbi:MAG: MBOAT family O-acyltransferase [Planctomycetota bacterium]|nr:MBOAT family O-acyltransferase [Planctomycetota bacterium]